MEEKLSLREKAEVVPSLRQGLQMSGLILNLVLWNRLGADEAGFQSFISTLDEAPLESSACKFKNVDLVMNQVKGFVLGPGLKAREVSKKKLEKLIQAGIDEVTKDGFEILVRLLDPKPFNFTRQRGARRGFSRWLVFGEDEHNIRFPWRIIQRLPRVQEFLKTKIPETGSQS